MLALANLLLLTTEIDDFVSLLVIVDKLNCCAWDWLADLLDNRWILLLLLGYDYRLSGYSLLLDRLTKVVDNHVLLLRLHATLAWLLLHALLLHLLLLLTKTFFLFKLKT